MLYGAEKAREMARSILPSKSRGTARFFKQKAHGSSRRRVNMALREAMFEEPEYVGDDPDLYHTADHEVKRVIRWRRESDKVNHFVRWAHQVTADIDEKDARRAEIRKILPDSVIGWHAMEHLYFSDHFYDRPYRWWNRSRRNNNRRTDRDRKCMLYAICEDNRIHKALNRWMRRHHRMIKWHVGWSPTNSRVPEYEEVGPTSPRLLRGIGDIDDFMADLKKARTGTPIPCDPYVYKRDRRRCNFVWWNTGAHTGAHTHIWEWTRDTKPDPQCHPEWWIAMERFLNHCESCDFDYHAIIVHPSTHLIKV